MPAAADEIKLQIYKAALRQAQSPTIQKLSADTASALACKDMFPSIFSAELQTYEWPWSRKRVELEADDDAPLGATWSASYTLPDDFLRVRKVDTVGANTWELEGTKILCDSGEGIVLVYFAAVDLTAASPVFHRLVEKLLAAQLALELKKDRLLSRQLALEAVMIGKEAAAEASKWSSEPEPLSLVGPAGSDIR